MQKKSISTLNHYVYIFIQRNILFSRTPTHIEQYFSDDDIIKIKEFLKI